MSDDQRLFRALCFFVYILFPFNNTEYLIGD